ncbi:MAG: hydantoinase/oxoprolinase family protein [Gammaproteobacteria bacterium]
MRLIGVDVGGTFTDLMYADTDSGETVIHKVPTTPDDPSSGVLDGLSQLCDRFDIARSEIDHVLHGTTIATNAVLEYKGAKSGMVTTKGYRDIIHIGRHQRPEHYSIMQDVPWQDRPLVKRRHRKVVAERLAPPHGEVIEPLDEDAVRQAARELKAEGVAGVAVCFLYSYLDPAHEERAKAIIEEEYPGCFVTTSASVSPQFREFERFTTTAMNAFIGPKVREYVSRLSGSLNRHGLSADLHIMGSNGGVATAAMVAERPVMTLLSGPAAGVLGGAWSGQLCGRDDLITFDAGGTSADIGIVTDGRFVEATARDTWIAGYPLMVPMIDIHTIGAGGGSIAYVDEGGAFKVGPQSAGARPGPAAYGQGGTRPTVTDANVVLGRLDPENFLGGEMSLNASAATTAIDELAAKLALNRMESAEGVLTILNANMANAIRSRTVQKGMDPRGYTLVAFGGAGPLHGADVAAMLDIPEVIVPPHPGITSATGLLTTDLKYDGIRTSFQVSGSVNLDRINADFSDMEAAMKAQLEADGVPPAKTLLQRTADLRYVGQGYELRITLPGTTLGEAELESGFDQFQSIHKAEYGHIFPDNPIEIVNLRVTGIGEMPKVGPPRAPTGTSMAAARLKTGQGVFRTQGGLEEFETAFYARDRLPVGEKLTGPAVILQKDSTTVVRPQDTAQLDASGNLIIQIGANS